MPLHDAEARLPPIAVLPVGAGLRDVLVAAAHEVPPHHQVLGQRFATQHREASRAMGSGQANRGAIASEIEQIAAGMSQFLTFNGEGVRCHQHGVLKLGPKRQVELDAGIDLYLQANQW